MKKYLLVLLQLFAISLVTAQYLHQGFSPFSSADFMVQSSTQDTYTVGSFMCNLTVDTLHTGKDTCTEDETILNFYILKLNAIGKTQWLIQSDISDETANYQIVGTCVDSDDNLIIAGKYSGKINILHDSITSNFDNDIFIAKFTPQGNLDTLIGNFGTTASTYIYLNGLIADEVGNAYIFGSFNGQMKSSQDTVTHSNSQLFLYEINNVFETEFLVTKLDTPRITADSSHILAVDFASNKIKMLIGIDNGVENLIDTSYVYWVRYTGSGFLIPPSTNISNGDSVRINDIPLNDQNWSDTLNIDTVYTPYQQPITENTLINEYITGGSFNYLSRQNYTKPTLIKFDNVGDYYVLESKEEGGIKNIQLDKYGSNDQLLDSKLTINTNTQIDLLGNVLNFDNANNCYWGAVFNGTQSSVNFTVESTVLQSTRDKNSFIVKSTPTGITEWVQTIGSATTDTDYNLYNDVVNSILIDAPSEIKICGYFSQELSILGSHIENTEGVSNLFIGNLDPYPEFVAELNSSFNPVEICKGDSVLLTATNNANYTYVWKRNDTILVGENTNTIYAKDSASYRAEITDASLAYTKKTPAITVEVNPLPIALIETADDTVFCSGESASLQNNGGINYNYSWYRDGSAITDTDNRIYEATETGIYTMQVTSDKNCTANSNSIEIEVLETTAVISYSEELSICDGDSVLLNSSTGTDYKYQWLFDNEELSNDTLDFFYAKNSGAYQVQTTILESCSSISEAMHLSVTPSPESILTFSGDSVICSGEETSLAANSGFGLTHLWMLNNDTIPNEISSTLQTSTAGIYTVIVGYEGSCSRWSNNKQVIVNPLPEVSLQIIGDTNICEGSSTQLSTTNNVNYTYAWFNNSDTVAYGSNNSYSAIYSGNYYAWVTNNYNCTSRTQTQTIIVKQAPPTTLFIDTDSIFCEKDSVNIYTYDFANLAYQWYKNDEPINSAIKANYYASSSGNYSVQVTQTDLGCSATSVKQNMQMINTPRATISYNGTLPICDGDSLTFSVPDNETWKCQWLRNGYLMYQDTLHELVVKEAGNYSVILTNEANCSDTTANQPLTSLSNPVPPIEISGLFLATNQLGALQWKRNNEAISGANKHIYFVEESGVYKVTASYDNGCSATAKSVQMCKPLPYITIDESFLHASEGDAFQWYFEDEIIQGATQTIHRAQLSGFYSVAITCSGGYITFSDPVEVCIPVPEITQTAYNVLESTTGSSYLWYKNGEAIEGADARVLVVKSSGSYTVFVEDIYGCSSFAKAVDMNITGVQGYSSLINIYPNPCKGEVNVFITENVSQEAQIVIYDLTGNKLDVIVNKSSNNKINISSYPKGIYLLQLKMDKKTLYYKVVKE